MKNKRILFTGGGTAGHVIVNLALIPVFQSEGWEVDYIGSYNGIERQLIEPIEGVTYYAISTGKLRRYLAKENFKDPFKVMKGTLQALNIIRKRKPKVIFSKGGFVSVPVVTAAWMNRVPAVIHESDYTPGLANKIAIPFAKKVLATFPETMKYLPAKKAEWVGAVVREELFEGNKKSGYTLCKFKQEKQTLLVMGGSSGAKKINAAIRENLDVLLQSFNIIHICGKSNLDDSYQRKGYVQFEYVKDELKDLFAATDLVVSRAGANAIFEFLALRKPMLLIPLSRHASRGDQILNAHSFVKQGYARMVEEEEVTGKRMVDEINKLAEEQGKILEKMNAYRSDKAMDKVIKTIKNTAKKK